MSSYYLTNNIEIKLFITLPLSKCTVPEISLKLPMYLCTLAREFVDGRKKLLAIILVSVNDREYRLLHTVALRRPIPGFVKCENNTSIVSYLETG